MLYKTKYGNYFVIINSIIHSTINKKDAVIIMLRAEKSIQDVIAELQIEKL